MKRQNTRHIWDRATVSRLMRQDKAVMSGPVKILTYSVYCGDVGETILYSHAMSSAYCEANPAIHKIIEALAGFELTKAINTRLLWCHRN